MTTNQHQPANQYANVSTDTLREWRTGAWLCNRTDLLAEIHDEIARRNGACDCTVMSQFPCGHATTD